MQITITLDTTELNEADKRMLRALAGDNSKAEAVAAPQPEPEAEAPKAAKATKTSKKAEPEPEPEPEAGIQDHTMEDAVKLATKLVSSGETKKVKAALAAVDAKRVSELPEDKIDEFIASLS